MCLLPEQAARIFSECGLPAAPAGTAADMSEGGIALGAEPAPGRDPGRCAAQEVPGDSRYGLWDGHVRIMREYGTRVVTGIPPGQGGRHDGVPVSDTVTKARAATGAGIASSPWEVAAMAGKYAGAR